MERTHDWVLHGSRAGQPLEVRASFLIDATGPAGMLAQQLGIDTRPSELGTSSWSIYSHFVDVDRWSNVLTKHGENLIDHPFPCDDAALHHTLDDGWMWVLRFNNGVTRAGLVFDSERRTPDVSLTPEGEWEKVLGQYPAIADQFAQAMPVQPWIRTGRLQHRATTAVGDGWALLAHSAYFIDPLFSSGNAHTLLCIERLADLLESHWGRDRLALHLAEYERKLFREVEFLDWLVHGSYRTFHNFELFCTTACTTLPLPFTAKNKGGSARRAPATSFCFRMIRFFANPSGGLIKRSCNSAQPTAVTRGFAALESRSPATYDRLIELDCAIPRATTCTRTSDARRRQATRTHLGVSTAH